MIDALISGKLFKSPEEKRSSNGNTYVKASIRAADGDGESMFISVVAFNEQAKTALMALEDGDSVSLTGTLKIGIYEARDDSVKPSVSMIAQRALTAYHVLRKRRAVSDAPAQTANSSSTREPEFHDDEL